MGGQSSGVVGNISGHGSQPSPSPPESDNVERYDTGQSNLISHRTGGVGTPDDLGRRRPLGFRAPDDALDVHAAPAAARNSSLPVPDWRTEPAGRDCDRGLHRN